MWHSLRQRYFSSLHMLALHEVVQVQAVTPNKQLNLTAALSGGYGLAWRYKHLCQNYITSKNNG